MEYIVIALVAVAGASLVGWWLHGRSNAPAAMPARPPRQAAKPTVPTGPIAVSAPVATLPPEIISLQLARAGSLDPARWQTVIDTFSNVPRHRDC